MCAADDCPRFVQLSNDDIVGWAVGVSDLNGQLRAERPSRGRNASTI